MITTIVNFLKLQNFKKIVKFLIAIVPTIKKILQFIEEIRQKHEQKKQQKNNEEFNRKIDEAVDFGTLDDLLDLKKNK